MQLIFNVLHRSPRHSMRLAQGEYATAHQQRWVVQMQGGN